MLENMNITKHFYNAYFYMFNDILLLLQRVYQYPYYTDIALALLKCI